MRRATLAALILTAGLGLVRPGPVLAAGLEQASLGLAALAAGEYDRAVTLLTQAIDSDELPESEAYLFLAARGYARAGAGDRKDAIEDYDAALAVRPDYAPALFNRATPIMPWAGSTWPSATIPRSWNFRPTMSGPSTTGAPPGSARATCKAPWPITPRPPSSPRTIPTSCSTGARIYDALGESDLAREDFQRIRRIDPSARTPLD